MKIDIETLRRTKGIGTKTLERIIEQHELDNNIKSFKSEYIPSDKHKIDKDINLWQGDCLELMSHIPDKSVDLILCDLPYGTTACSWDEIIPFEPLWSHYKRIIKDEGVIALFGSEPFSTKLRMSNLDWYKYDWYWDKKIPSGMLNAKIQPMRQIETISIFFENGIYNPQMTTRATPITSGGNNIASNIHRQIKQVGTQRYDKTYKYKFPTTLLTFDKVRRHSLHPTQKPVALLEYLIKTYTNEDMLVLDNTMGSGSTGVACKNLNRKFIGIELDEEYFEVTKNRINEFNDIKL